MIFSRMLIYKFLWFFLPSITILTIVVIALYRSQVAGFDDLIALEDEKRLEIAARIIGDELQGLDEDLNYLLHLRSLQSWVEQGDNNSLLSLQAELKSFSTYYPFYDQIRVLDKNGLESVRVDRPANLPKVASSKDLLDKSKRYYTKALKSLDPGKIYLSPFDLNVERGVIEQPIKPMIRAGMAIYNRAGEFSGSLIVNYKGSNLLNELRSLNQEGKHQLWLLNQDGYWLIGPSAELEWGFMWDKKKDATFASEHQLVWENFMENGDAQGKDDTGVFQIVTIDSQKILPEVNNQRWYLVAFTPASYINTQNNATKKSLGSLYFLASFLLFFASGVISWKEALRRGYELQLEKSEQKHRSLLEGAPDPVVVFDQEGEVKFVNASFTEVFGFTNSELLGQSIAVFMPERIYSIVEKKIRKALSGATLNSMSSYKDLQLRRKDGSEVPIEMSLSTSSQDEGVLMTVIIRDVSESKKQKDEIIQLNRSLKKHAIELESTNKEMEAFCYSVSHDLRAPLRAIDGFSMIVLKDYGDKLDAKGKDRLERVRNGAQRMALLIDDLLTLSRITRAEMVKEELDFSVLVKDVEKDIRQLDEDRKIKCFIQPGMKAFGDAKLLTIAMTNLLSNAWKFTAKKDDATISVQSELINDQIIYSVKDNGAGFNMEYAEKLFGAFQRLHDESEFPGTGVGLATVQRVIIKHGGRVWAESEVGRGSTFYFTLDMDKNYEEESDLTG